MKRFIQLCVFFSAFLTPIVAAAQGTWQKTYAGLSAATSVVPAFDEGYIIGGTLDNGNGVLIKITEEGKEVWRSEIAGQKGIFIRDVIPSAADGSYYFAGTEGFTNYISNSPLFPMSNNWKLQVSGLVGKINQAGKIDWVKKDLLVKGTAATSPLHVRLTGNYLLVSGYTSDDKSKVNGFMQLYQRNDGTLVKEQKLDEHVQDIYARGDQILALSILPQKGSYALQLTTLNEQLKKQEEKKSGSVVLSNFYSYPMHLLAFNNTKYACAFFHYFGASKIECGCFPVFANMEVNPKAHDLTPSVQCNGGCFFIGHSQDANSDFVLTGLSQSRRDDLYAGSRMLWHKYTNDYKAGTTRSYSYAEINKADVAKYTHTIGYDIAPTRSGGSIMAGFATNLKGESAGTFKERIGWVLKVNPDGTW